MNKFAIPALLFLMLFISACDTTGKVLKRATALEAKGRYEDAAMAYIQVLQKNPNLSNARSGLQSTGDAAIRAILTEPTRDPKAQVSHYRRVDGLVQKADAVNLSLTLPATYQSDRRRAFNDVIRDLVTRAENLAIENKWEQALNSAREALQYEPDPDAEQMIRNQMFDLEDQWSKDLAAAGLAAERKRDWSGALRNYEKATEITPDERMKEEMTQARSNVLFQWAEDDIRYNKFRAAYDKLGRALEMAPRNERARSLMEEAMRRGSRKVAFLPLYRTAAAIQEMPDSFVQELNEELQFGYWGKPPAFVITSDPRDIRREMRKDDLEGRVLSDDKVYLLGRRIGGDFIVFGEIDRFVVTERNVRERDRNASTFSKQKVTYKEVIVERKVEVGVSFRILELSKRRLFTSGGTRHTEVIQYKTAKYAGNMADLDLNREQRGVFNGEDKRENLNNMITKMVREIGKKTASGVYAKLLEGIE
ncbi:MAG TPA: hypothetical protein PLO56_07365 [Rhodothermales bacterium]|nr:hypothetical protein [Rhodothermales bacterium]